MKKAKSYSGRANLALAAPPFTEERDPVSNFPETPKNKNSHAEMTERQRLRAEGKLNAPNRGVRGLANLAKHMRENGFNPSQYRLDLSP